MEISLKKKKPSTILINPLYENWARMQHTFLASMESPFGVWRSRSPWNRRSGPEMKVVVESDRKRWKYPVVFAAIGCNLLFQVLHGAASWPAASFHILKHTLRHTTSVVCILLIIQIAIAWLIAVWFFD